MSSIALKEFNMDITFIIQTFLRPACLDKLLKSIEKYYPDVPVLIYDDSEYDRGLSWGRNYLVSQVKTKYFLLLDDDFVFTSKTKIEKLVAKAEQGYDLVAGALLQDKKIIHYEGRYEYYDNILKYIPSTTEPLDFVFNFFVARTEKIKECQWDEDLKLAEHTSFFFRHRGKLKIGYIPEVIVEHCPDKSDPEYVVKRRRGGQYFRKFMRKKGIKEVIGFDGGSLKLDISERNGDAPLRILLAGWDFETLTGGPMYNYNLAKGLKELGHDVVCAGEKAGGIIKERLNEIGCQVYKIDEKNKWSGRYDLVVISENIPEFLNGVSCDNIYNFCHSKHELDKPINDVRITGYLYPRKQVADHWKLNGTIIPIPIDFSKFHNNLRPRERYTIVCPATIDRLRKPMFLNLINRARMNPKIDVWIVGKDHGGLDGVKYPNNVRVFNETPFPEKFINQADEVAGIFIGTTTIEAWAADKKTSVYDELGNWHYEDKPKDFEKYNYKNVTQEFLKLIK